MNLSKPFALNDLANALKAAGIADAEKLVNDALPVIFDWLNSSAAVAIPAPYGLIASTVLSELEAKALEALKSVEPAP